MEPPLKLGVDIGGTFTDLVATTPSGQSWRVKVPTSTKPVKGALESIGKFLDTYQVNPARVRVVVHATTLASNALLSGSLPGAALVTTEGFRDVLEIGRQNRPELYNLQVERIRPLIPRRHRFELRERIAFDGRILQALDTEQARRLVEKIRRLGIRSVAVCFLHSYTNPRHERLLADLFRREAPRVSVCISSDLLPEFREYERTSTTVVNACLQPLVAEYLSNLRNGLAYLGIRAPLFVMQSNSGTILSQQAADEPARIIESGPVAGAVAAKAYGKLSKADRIISLDVGGTTSKAGVWSSERFDVTYEYEVGGRVHGVRRLQGSGYPVRFPYVDLVEVGTGGGSIAHVDGAGVLHVGPESAGASPGPACYGTGGELPTVTDANLVLGRLNPECLLGGELKVYLRLAETAIRKHVAKPLGTGVLEAAVGVLKVANANMVGVIRAASVEKGHDPRKMTLVAFGGAGPMHACEIAEQLEISKVLVPPAAGLFSSTGLLLAEPLHDFVQTILVSADDADGRLLTRKFDALEKKGTALLMKEGLVEREIILERFFDMRYEGQAYELSIPIANRTVDKPLVSRAVQTFHRLHNDKYGYSDPANRVELVNIRLYCRGGTKLTIPRFSAAERPETVSKSYRRIFLGGRFVGNCPVYNRATIRIGSRGKGPCLVEDYDSTLVLPEGSRYVVDEFGTFKISLPH